MRISFKLRANQNCLRIKLKGILLSKILALSMSLGIIMSSTISVWKSGKGKKWGLLVHRAVESQLFISYCKGFMIQVRDRFSLTVLT